MTSYEDNDEFDCPICLEEFNAPIYQCVKGHSVCKNCRQKINKCPTCRHLFGDTRNYYLEKLVENKKAKNPGGSGKAGPSHSTNREHTPRETGYQMERESNIGIHATYLGVISVMTAAFALIVFGFKRNSSSRD